MKKTKYIPVGPVLPSVALVVVIPMSLCPEKATDVPVSELVENIGTAALSGSHGHSINVELANYMPTGSYHS